MIKNKINLNNESQKLVCEACKQPIFIDSRIDVHSQIICRNCNFYLNEQSLNNFNDSYNYEIREFKKLMAIPYKKRRNHSRLHTFEQKFNQVSKETQENINKLFENPEIKLDIDRMHEDEKFDENKRKIINFLEQWNSERDICIFLQTILGIKCALQDTMLVVHKFIHSSDIKTKKSFMTGLVLYSVSSVSSKNFT